VGCGGGRTIRELALLAPEGKVYGIDCSAVSVAVASSLPFATETFGAKSAATAG